VSRDIDARVLLDHRTERPAGGTEMPRGGRSGGTRSTHEPARDGVHGALARRLELPRGRNREPVRVGSQTVALRGSEVRTLAVVGAFRVVDARDLGAGAADRWHGDLEHLRAARLITTTPHVLAGERTALVTLTERGRSLLDTHRRRDPGGPVQAYYAGLAKPREASHDAQLCRVYTTAAERLEAGGACIRRVVLDYELKRDYQRFLQDRNRGDARSSGRPDRSREEVRAWAAAQGLPIVRDRVQFPDVRIEYERPDGRVDREDLELATSHYNSRQMAAKRASGFSLQRSAAARLGGAKGRRGTAPFDPHVAEAVLR
jgi:hypothetical protein